MPAHKCRKFLVSQSAEFGKTGITMNAASFTSPAETAPAMLHATLQRLAGQSAACKIWGAVLSATALLFAAGRAGGEPLLWAATPVILLALADAGYVGQSRRIAAYVARREPKELGNTKDIVHLLVQGSAFPEAFKSLASVLSLSVWPFYLSLAGLVAGLGMTVLVPKNKPAPVLPSFPQTTPAYTQQNSPFPNPRPANTPVTPARPFPGPSSTNPAFNTPAFPSPPKATTGANTRPATVRPQPTGNKQLPGPTGFTAPKLPPGTRTSAPAASSGTNSPTTTNPQPSSPSPVTQPQPSPSPAPPAPAPSSPLPAK